MIDELLLTVAARHPGQPALAWGERQFTYGELVAAVERLADRLAGTVTTGARVAIVAPNVPALAVALFATWCLGAVAVPLSARNREFELERAFKDAEPVAILAVESYRGYSFVDLLPRLLPQLPSVRRALFVDASGDVTGELGPAGGADLPSVEPLDPAIGLMLYTSGTTGTPKGVLVTRDAVVAGAHAARAVLRARPDDIVALVIPIPHAFGLVCFLAAIAAGSRVVLVESSFSIEPTLEAIGRHGATVLHGSPTLFTLFLKSYEKAQRAGRGTLRTGHVAGAACSPQTLEALDAAGLRILNLYGMTEIGNAACCRPDDPPHIRYTTVGRPLPGYDFRIVDGMVQVRGPYVTPGYYRQPVQTAGAFDGEWLRTGDLGALDGEGNLTIAGRAKDVVHVAGNTVFPAEVESFLLTHPDVTGAVVVGVPHPIMGEVTQAFVVARPGAGLTPQALLQFARARIAGYKLPYAIRLLTEFPTLASGKPDRIALIRLLQQEQDRGGQRVSA